MNDHGADAAAENFRRGYSCAQSVCAAFADEVRLSREAALALASPFGAGVAREGQICGAISGALLILGTRHWSAEPDVAAGKERVYAAVQSLLDAIKARHGTILCRDLLGQGLSSPAEREAAHDKGLFQSVCAPLVREVAELLEKAGSEGGPSTARAR